MSRRPKGWARRLAQELGPPQGAEGAPPPPTEELADAAGDLLDAVDDRKDLVPPLDVLRRALNRYRGDHTDA